MSDQIPSDEKERAFRALCAVLEIGASGRRQLTASVANEALSELTRLRADLEKAKAALLEILDHCANTGRGNEIVDSRIVDRVDDAARATLTEIRRERDG